MYVYIVTYAEDIKCSFKFKFKKKPKRRKTNFNVILTDEFYLYVYSKIEYLSLFPFTQEK